MESRPKEDHPRVSSDAPRYCAYLLRCWEVVGVHGSRTWRFSLEDAHTGARQGFADVTSLAAFLRSTTERDDSFDRAVTTVE